MSHKVTMVAASNQVPRGVKAAIAELRRAQGNERLAESIRIDEVQLAAQRSGYPASEGSLERGPLEQRLEDEIDRLKQLYEYYFE
jgi:hypothetical protein